MAHFGSFLHVHSDMAGQPNWGELLEKRFPSYKAEVTAFLDTLHISKSTDVSIEKIYEVIKDNCDIPDDLKALYNECINGTDKAVKLCMKSRVGNFKHGLRLDFLLFFSI